jgi:WD40 repeat protein
MESRVPHHSMERWSALTLVDREHPHQRTVLGTRSIISPARGWQRLEEFFAPDSRLSADGRFVAMGFLQKEDARRARDKETSRVAIVDLATGTSRICDGPPVRGLQMAPDSKSFVTLNTDSTLSSLRLGDSLDLSATPPATRIASRTFPLKSVEAICFTPDSRRLVLVGDRSETTQATTEWTVVILDARSLHEARRWTLEASGLPWYTAGHLSCPPKPALAVSADNRTLAVSAPLPTHIRFFDLDTGREHLGFGGHNDAVTELVSSAPGQRLISASADHVGRVWDLERVRALAAPPGAMPTALRGHGTQAASIRESEILPKLDAADLPRPQTSRFKVLYDRANNRMELRNAESDHLLRIYEEDSFAADEEANRPKSLPTALGPTEEWFAYAVKDRVVVRALDSGQLLATFQVPFSTPTAVASIPGSDLLAVGYHDGQILVWDLLPRDIPRTPPSLKDYERLWRDLGGDVQLAARARAVMLAHPTATVAALRELAKPFPRPTDFDIDAWIVRLTHSRHIERERAARELTRHFEVAESAMRDVLASTRSLEMEERLRRILDRRTDPVGDADDLRLMRAAAILERIGTPEATKELFRLARGGGQAAERAADGLVRMKERKKEWATLAPLRGIW